MKVTPNRSFLMRQEDVEGGKRKDIIAKKGVKMEMTEQEAVKFWGGLDLSDDDKKKLLKVSKAQKISRVI